MIEKIKRIKEWTFGKAQGPVQIQAHLTNFCNLKCSFCPTRTLLKKSELKKDKELSKEDWFRLIKESKKLGVKEWHICGGGEPFFDRNLAYDVMAEIKKNGFYGELITNGTLLTNEIIKNLTHIRWDKITFSIDGHNAEIHDSIRGIPCFVKATKNIKLFALYKKKLDKSKPKLSFHTVVCNKNYNHLPELFKLAKKLCVQDVLLNALNIWSNDIKRLELNAEQQTKLNQSLQSSEKLANELNINTNISDFRKLDMFNKANKIVQAMEEESVKEPGLFGVPCYMPWYNIAIFADGRIQPCFILQDKGESYKDKTLREIWYGSYFNAIRQAMTDKKLDNVCSRCNPWSFSKNKEICNALRDAIS